MKVYEIGTGYTPIPANIGAATEIVVEELTKSMMKKGIDVSKWNGSINWQIYWYGCAAWSDA